MKNLFTDKRGVSLTGGVVLLAVAIILTIIFGIAFLVSNSFKFYIIGIIIILFSLFFGFKNGLTKEKKPVFYIALLVGIGFIFVPALGLIQTGYSSTFTPIYCNDYSFTCCNDKVSTQSWSSSISSGFLCPVNSNYCKLISQSGSGSQNVYNGISNCKNAYHIGCGLISNTFACDDGSLTSTNSLLNKGSYTYTCDASTLLSLEVHQNQLVFCGRAGCTNGVPVSGADGCTFNPTAVYDSSGQIVKVDKSGTSYTSHTGECVLSWNPGDRHICGNLEEQCTQDTDCIGHTYGNKECTARTLQTYGCKTYGNLPSGVQNINGQYVFYNTESASGNFGNIQTKRCEVISTNQVQCCGDTDCGSNAVCDRTTFTCKASGQVICVNDYDCGTSTQCDINSKQLKTPVCNSGKCGYSTKSINCCTTSDCPNSYFCGTDNTCKQSSKPCTDCPFECCSGECSSNSGYLDKPCSTGLFCVSNRCQSEGCKADSECKLNQECINGQCIDNKPGECKWYQEFLTKSTTKYSWYNYIGIGKPQVTLTSGCYTSSIIYFIIGAIAVVIVLVFLIVYLKQPKRRRKK